MLGPLLEVRTVTAGAVAAIFGGADVATSLAGAAAQSDALIMTNAPAIADVLVAGGRDAATPVAVVCDGSMPAERTVLTTLGGLADALEAQAVRAPAIIVVGEVVRVAHPEAF